MEKANSKKGLIGDSDQLWLDFVNGKINKLISKSTLLGGIADE